jgi:hypothetical protein
MIAALTGTARSVIAADTDAPGLDRVRSSNPSIAALISLASEQSKAFRRLIETINASDGIVYVEEGTCGHGVQACFVAVKVSGANRILLVKVDTHKADWDLMGSIGHELRHAIEVLGERSVTTSSGMYMFYSRVGSRGTATSFETAAAVEAGAAVRGEVRKYRARAKAH